MQSVLWCLSGICYDKYWWNATHAIGVKQWWHYQFVEWQWMLAYIPSGSEVQVMIDSHQSEFVSCWVAAAAVVDRCISVITWPATCRSVWCTGWQDKKACSTCCQWASQLSASLAILLWSSRVSDHCARWWQETVSHRLLSVILSQIINVASVLHSLLICRWITNNVQIREDSQTELMFSHRTRVLPYTLQGGPKNRGHSVFSGICRKLPKKITTWFLHSSRSMYARHVYNVRVCSFYYIKWHHLVNLLPLDNAVLKLKHNGLLTLILT